jgi:hypothetical protein
LVAGAIKPDLAAGRDLFVRFQKVVYDDSPLLTWSHSTP